MKWSWYSATLKLFYQNRCVLNDGLNVYSLRKTESNLKRNRITAINKSGMQVELVSEF